MPFSLFYPPSKSSFSPLGKIFASGASTLLASSALAVYQPASYSNDLTLNSTDSSLKVGLANLAKSTKGYTLYEGKDALNPSQVVVDRLAADYGVDWSAVLATAKRENLEHRAQASKEKLLASSFFPASNLTLDANYNYHHERGEISSLEALNDLQSSSAGKVLLLSDGYGGFLETNSALERVTLEKVGSTPLYSYPQTWHAVDEAANNMQLPNGDFAVASFFTNPFSPELKGKVANQQAGLFNKAGRVKLYHYYSGQTKAFTAEDHPDYHYKVDEKTIPFASLMLARENAQVRKLIHRDIVEHNYKIVSLPASNLQELDILLFSFDQLYGMQHNGESLFTELMKRYPNNKRKVLNELIAKIDVSQLPNLVSAVNAQQHTLDFMSEHKEQDVLFVQGTGDVADYTKPLLFTTYNGAYTNSEALNLSLADTSYEEVKDNYLQVTSFSEQAVPCDLARDYCLVANGEVSALATDKIATLDYDPLVVNIHHYQKGELITKDRTSFAAAYVSSLASVVKDVFPFFSANNLQQTLLTTATDLGDHARYVWWRVNPLKALKGPAQFIAGKNFTVDLSKVTVANPAVGQPSTIANFANDISGEGGLELTASDAKKANILLNLSGNNSYQGDTVVKGNARLNLDGRLANSKVIVTEEALFSGVGSFKELRATDNARILAYSLNSALDTDQSKEQLTVTGEANFAPGTSLEVNLDQPLLSLGKATIDNSTLYVRPSKVQEHKGFYSGVVLVAQEGIQGNFATIKTTNSLLSVEGATVVNNLEPGSNAQSLLLSLRSQAAVEAFKNSDHSKLTTDERGAADNLDVIRKDLPELEGDLLGLTDKEVVATAKFLAAPEYGQFVSLAGASNKLSRTLGYGDLLASYGELYHDSNEGLSVRSTLAQGKQKGLFNLNHLTYHLQREFSAFNAGLVFSNDSFKGTFSTANSKIDGKGFYFNYGYFLTPLRTLFSAGFAVHNYQGDIVRKGSFLAQAQHFTTYYKQRAVSIDLGLSPSFNFGTPSTSWRLRPFFGISTTYHQAAQVEEKLGKYQFQVAKLDYFDYAFRLGLRADVKVNAQFSAFANYSLDYSRPSEVKKLKAQLVHNNRASAVELKVTERSLLQLLDLGLEYQFTPNFKASLYGEVLNKEGFTKGLGFKAEYNF